MDFWIETKTLYAVYECFDLEAKSAPDCLDDYLYLQIIGWGAYDGKLKGLQGKIFPYVIDEMGILEMSEEHIAIINSLPLGCEKKKHALQSRR
jgi:hypothetical protein